MPIKEHEVIRKESSILIGIAVESAALDFVSSEAQLQECLKILQESHKGMVRPQLGSFGSYSVALNVDNDEAVSIFIDGPYFNPSRSISAAIWLGKEELRRLLVEALGQA
jgi:hypothetical protein